MFFLLPLPILFCATWGILEPQPFSENVSSPLGFPTCRSLYHIAPLGDDPNMPAEGVIGGVRGVRCFWEILKKKKKKKFFESSWSTTKSKVTQLKGLC